MITMEGKYQTRDGRAVRILCVDGPASRRPVVGLIDECSAVLLWTCDGYACPDGPSQSWDLVPVPTKHEGWCVVYADGDYRTAVKDHFLFSTEEFARGWAETEKLFHDTAHVAHVTWES